MPHTTPLVAIFSDIFVQLRIYHILERKIMCLYVSLIGSHQQHLLKTDALLKTNKATLKVTRRYVKRKRYESARGRTWNLLLRRQTRYPLRHKPAPSQALRWKQTPTMSNVMIRRLVKYSIKNSLVVIMFVAYNLVLNVRRLETQQCLQITCVADLREASMIAVVSFMFLGKQNHPF